MVIIYPLQAKDRGKVSTGLNSRLIMARLRGRKSNDLFIQYIFNNSEKQIDGWYKTKRRSWSSSATQQERMVADDLRILH
jgi:hypothetical protein